MVWPGWWAAMVWTRVSGPQEPVQVPYSPYFLQQARAGNVKEITSTGTAVQGTFKHAVSYQGTRASEFSTEIPEFANNDALSKLLQSKQVVVNAKPLDTGPSRSRRCCSGLARPCSCSGCCSGCCAAPRRWAGVRSARSPARGHAATTSRRARG
jgi:hypothetical protein